MPSVTNRQWGRDRSDNANSFGYKGQGGYGDFTTAAHPVERGHRGRGPSGYVRADASIADEIIDRLTEDAALDASEILLQVDDGVALLTGNVPVRAMKHRAEDIAAEARGVRDVRNEIRVDNGSASAGRPGEAVRSGT
jgi:osmotically-inducible protein OsmY